MNLSFRPSNRSFPLPDNEEIEAYEEMIALEEEEHQNRLIAQDEDIAAEMRKLDEDDVELTQGPNAVR